MDQIITPELLETIIPMIGGGSSAYVFVKIGLFVLGKVVERRRANQAKKQEEENLRERRRIGRVLDLIRSVVSATEKPPSPPVAESKEPVEIEELVTAVVAQLRKR